MFAAPMLMKPSASGVDYEAEVDALLSGTTGWAIDLTDASTLFTDTAGTVPVATPGVDTVARMNSKFGTTAYNWVNPTGASQGVWNSDYVTFDGGDWYDCSSDTFSADMPGCTLTMRIKASSLSATNYLFGHGRGPFGQRFNTYINTDGSITFQCRRALADTLTTIVSATGLISAGTAVTLQFIADYSGTGDISILLDGSSVASGTMAGSAANSENVGPTRSRIGRVPTNAAVTHYTGDMQRIVHARSVLDSTGLDNCRGYVEMIAL